MDGASEGGDPAGPQALPAGSITSLDDSRGRFLCRWSLKEGLENLPGRVAFASAVPFARCGGN